MFTSIPKVGSQARSFSLWAERTPGLFFFSFFLKKTTRQVGGNILCAAIAAPPSTKSGKKNRRCLFKPNWTPSKPRSRNARQIREHSEQERPGPRHRCRRHDDRHILRLFRRRFRGR